MITPFGKITIEVDTINAPLTAKNFLKHVSGGTFEEAVFYRTVHADNQSAGSVKLEVIQGGLFHDEKIAQHKGIFHETTKATGLKHLDGTISMARSEPGTASTEFFICIGEQPELDFGGKRNSDGQGFAAFGKVIHGMKVVRKIQKLPHEGQYLKQPAGIVMSIKKERQ
ncbi:MAG: peptidylprolyl isomerase [Mariniphaga sp.]